MMRLSIAEPLVRARPCRGGAERQLPGHKRRWVVEALLNPSIISLLATLCTSFTGSISSRSGCNKTLHADIHAQGAAPEPSASRELHLLLQGGRRGGSARGLQNTRVKHATSAALLPEACIVNHNVCRITSPLLHAWPTCERSVDILRQLLHCARLVHDSGFMGCRPRAVVHRGPKLKASSPNRYNIEAGAIF